MRHGLSSLARFLAAELRNDRRLFKSFRDDDEPPVLLLHSLEELKTICRCGRKAIFTTRRIDGRAIFDGAQVAIDGGAEVTYEAVCAACYLAESGGRLP